MTKLLKKIINRIVRYRLTPIQVFCFHHISCLFDEKSMNEGDWINIDDFKLIITKLIGGGYRFVSLSKAYSYMKDDMFRRKRYAVITFDDGYASLKEVLPWLQKENIPVTLFVNGKYLDGLSYRDTPNEKYLTKDELFSLNSSLIEIAHHGWEHKDVTEMSPVEFEDQIIKNLLVISSHPKYIPFWSYTWGKHNDETDNLLRNYGLVPVLMDGSYNYNDIRYIHRCLF